MIKALCKCLNVVALGRRWCFAWPPAYCLGQFHHRNRLGFGRLKEWRSTPAIGHIRRAGFDGLAPQQEERHQAHGDQFASVGSYPGRGGDDSSAGFHCFGLMLSNCECRYIYSYDER